ncbi:MAG: response regulator [Desulfobacteraceae bacterium]|nr:response regulator [Desulfobacteraceae bacterium]
MTLTFLLVDDEPELIKALAQRLRHRGYEADCLFSGKEALKRLEDDHAIDVVVLDIRMPEYDGVETVRELKKTHPLVEVIMLTGHADVQSAVDTIQYGAFDYLTKPCDIDLLISKAEKAYSRKKEREARIFDIRTKPYTTKQERDEMMAKVLKDKA